MKIGKYAPLVAVVALSGALSSSPVVASAQDLSLSPSVSSASSTTYLHDMFGKTAPDFLRVCNEQHHNNFFHSNNTKHGCLTAKGGTAEDIFKV